MTLQAKLTAPSGMLKESDEVLQDTARIQQAIDSCAPGKAVQLSKDGGRNIFLSGPVRLKAGVTLLVDANTALFGSRNPRDYDLAPGSCGVVNERGHGCKPLITADDAPNSGIMGDGAIDGRGGEKLIGQNETWWDLARRAKMEDKEQSCTRILVVRHSDNFILYRITLRNSPNFHVAVDQTNGFTAWGVKIMTPKTARNTDGIDPGSSTNVTIAYSSIHTGDDNVAIKTGRTPTKNVSILHNHFYTGHGMSIGSGTAGGVDHVLVQDLTIDGADNGIRIKSDRSRGGLVQNVLYQDVCIRNVTNPIIFTPFYTTLQGNLLPVYRDIVLKNVRVVTHGSYTFVGLDADHKLGVTLDSVFADDLAHSEVRANHAEIHVAGRRGNLLPSGEDVTASGADTPEAKPMSCEDRFVPFPPLPSAPEAANTVLPEDKTLYVAADGTGDFYSVQRAIDVAPEAGGASIRVAPGRYREVLTIMKPGITIRGSGDDPSKVVVVNDRSSGTAGGTLNSATVNVRADDFVAENITFENDYNKTHEQLYQGSQALALLVTGDRAIFRNVRLLGNQDTVYAGSRDCTPPNGEPCIPARQYFVDCYIAGNVDFIFGDGKAVFDHCEIHNTQHTIGFVTAQGKHYPAQDSGFVFNHCKLTAEPGVSEVYLGRPWRPYATVIFLNADIGAHIQPVGWREWHPGETHSIDTVFYAEYASTGPSGSPSQRDPHTKFLSDQEASAFAPATFLRGKDGWAPVNAAR